MNGKNHMLYRIVYTGLFAAMVFVVTLLIKIDIPMTPPTMLKAGNILCLLGGLLFGGVMGGLSAGIGSFLFDLTNPNYAPEAPITLVFFFIMGFTCGAISHLRGAKGDNMALNAIGAVSGAAIYWVLNIGKNVLKLVWAGSALQAALIANLPRMGTSAVNAVIAVGCSLLLIKPLQRALKSAGVMQKLER